MKQIFAFLLSVLSVVLFGCGGSSSSEDGAPNPSPQPDVVSISGECWYQVDTNGNPKMHTESIKWIQNGGDIIGRFYPQSTGCEEGTPGISQVAGTISSQDNAYFIELSSLRNYCGGAYFQSFEGELTSGVLNVSQRYYYTTKDCLGDDSKIHYMKYKRK